ncbi:RT0821/Lpp0805 family surface protein [Roseibium algae]|uniref:RT0821/Lpp0805 family surface protein n=1 Tax=Roseibium algae TaxID=3123038 RepID=A0ABU8TGW9_9HYPH
MPLGSADVETPLVLTGSISSAVDVAFTDVDPVDRQIIAYTLDQLTTTDAQQLSYTNGDQERLRWSNPESGNSGKVSDIDLTVEAETGCMAFKTTANTIAGVRIYSGTACRDISKRLMITSLVEGNA